MRRKLLSVALCVCMMLTMAPFAFAEGETTESATTNQSSNSSGSGSGTVTPTAGITTEDALKEAISNASENETITLSGNITLTAPIIIEKKITLDMAGHTFSNTQDIWNADTPAWSFISVQANGDLTITGNGTFQTKENDCYAVDVQDGATLTIENGTFVGNIHAIYVFEGSLFVNGGTYSIQQKYTNANQADEFVLNCYDANRRNGSATISVSGGSFVNFNPANCQAEGIATNFCADGYTTTSTTNSGETIYTVGTGTNSSVANAGTNYNTLQSAINSVEANSSSTQTVTLLKDVTEDIAIPSGKTLTLDLNGKKLTNVSSDTITVASGAKLTITGEGTVDNVTHGKADIYNNGTVILNSGNYIRSQEAENTTETSGGNSYYNILNHGDMTIDGAVKVLSTGHFSSLVANGYYSYSSTNPRDGYVSGTNQEKPNLTIKDGSFSGGINTIKNDDVATLTINGGTFTNYTQAALQNHGTATVTAGSFTANSKYAIDNCGCDATNDPGKLEISGGTFNGTLYIRSAHSNVTISDGYFNGSISKTGGTLTISGGYFTSDPSAYCVSGKTGIPSTEPGYAFTVGEKATNVKPATAAPAVDDSKIAETDKATATAVGQSVQDTTGVLSAAANEAASEISNAQVAQAKEQLKRAVSSVGEQTQVYTYAQTYLKVTPTAVEKGTDGSITSITLDIQPMYRVVASTESADQNFEFTGDSKNAVVLTDSEKPLTNIQTMEISLELPTGFATAGSFVYVQHKGHEYIAAVTDKQISSQDTTITAKQIATFTNPDGFSEFTISKDPVAVATIGQNRYTTLQDAIDAVQNNETITLLKDTNEKVTVSKAIKFTLAGKDYLKGSIAAGSRYSMTTSETNGKTEYTFTYVGGGSSSSISTPTTYAVNVNAATNGAVAADKKTASKGTTVTVTASPSKGYVVDAVKVVDKDGKDVAVTEKDGKYVFTMPASAVTVTGSFKAETPAPVALPFTDVKSGNWFYDAVKYAYAQGLMTGTSATTFAPNGTMNRAMIVTVLYRLEKSPAVTGASKFTDVPAGQWYSDAVAWAAANNIVNGYDETTFGPMNAVTREQMAAILFRYEQYKGLENVTLEENLNRFPDQNKISAYAIPALQWAVGQKIINGNADGTLDPTGTATRAQVAQIFTNLLNK